MFPKNEGQNPNSRLQSVSQQTNRWSQGCYIDNLYSLWLALRIWTEFLGQWDSFSGCYRPHSLRLHVLQRKNDISNFSKCPQKNTNSWPSRREWGRKSGDIITEQWSLLMEEVRMDGQYNEMSDCNTGDQLFPVSYQQFVSFTFVLYIHIVTMRTKISYNKVLILTQTMLFPWA